MSFLHMRAGQFHLLLDSSKVCEVLEFAAAEEDKGLSMHNHRLWRGNRIKTLDLRRILSTEVFMTAGYALVCRETGHEAPFMLLFDQILGMVHAEPADFKCLPRNAGLINELADSLLPDPLSARLLFHLLPGSLMRLASSLETPFSTTH